MQSAVTILARRFHRNQQYSIVALTNGGGAVTERYAYDAYGTPTILDASGTTLTTSVDNNRHTYTGREYDEALGLYHYRARMYDSVAGRFCSRDPIGYEGSPWNLYEALFGLDKTDPSGMEELDQDCQLAVIIALGVAVGTAAACGSCFGDPEPVSRCEACALCVGALAAFAAALDNVSDECEGQFPGIDIGLFPDVPEVPPSMPDPNDPTPEPPIDGPDSESPESPRDSPFPFLP